MTNTVFNMFHHWKINTVHLIIRMADLSVWRLITDVGYLMVSLLRILLNYVVEHSHKYI